MSTSHKCTHGDCEATFKHKRDVQRHINNVHFKIKAFKCEECGKEFTNKTKRQNHVDGVHKLKKKYPCRSCGKAFTGSDGRANHERLVHRNRLVQPASSTNPLATSLPAPSQGPVWVPDSSLAATTRPTSTNTLPFAFPPSTEPFIGELAEYTPLEAIHDNHLAIEAQQTVASFEADPYELSQLISYDTGCELDTWLASLGENQPNEASFEGVSTSGPSNNHTEGRVPEALKKFQREYPLEDLAGLPLEDGEGLVWTLDLNELRWECPSANRAFFCFEVAVSELDTAC
ncbi:hypothetical protein BU16DRAFT_563379 [Lophium mytilinum]|uniref:C2H2-type domain-containing protein n=1 Tax=Lophium mytilinum TaxID=390894 RepID=A0A6A6QLS2_9PEZI|nr:hypothetical protein BU16DRAFT_563379 [Lophium mytilinum]